MDSAGDAARRCRAVDDRLPCGVLRERFLGGGGPEAVPVARNGHCTHLLFRHQLLSAFAGRYGFALLQDRPLGQWIDAMRLAPAVRIPAATPLAEVLPMWRDRDAAQAGGLVNDDPGEPLVLTYPLLVEAFLAQAARRERDLIAARDLALAGVRARSQFIATMHHELRTPLTAILGFSELLAGTDDLHEVHDSAAQIHRAGSHLLSLVNAVLDISTLESGSMRMERHPIDLRPLLTDAVGMISPLARDKRLALDLTIEPDLPPVIMGDPRRLTQVLVNILGNACKFTDQGGIRLHAALMPDRLLTLEVTDTGCGIAAQDLARLFTPFVQVDATSSRRHEGSGLGLAISRRLVDAMGGRMEVDSVPGQGSCFRVVLPLAAGPRTRAGRDNDAAQAAEIPPPGLLTA